MVKLNKIYTRTGDDGTTGLVDGSRTPKSDPRMHAIGDVDETNSAIGGAVAEIRAASLGAASEVFWLSSLFERIQNDLFDLGADLATPIKAPGASAEGALRIIPSQVERLEREIDSFNERLAPLTSFILPGGTKAASAIHIARAMSRRAERSAVAAGEHVNLNPEALRYLNRLSDYLFVAARVVNQSASGDVLWVPGASR